MQRSWWTAWVCGMAYYIETGTIVTRGMIVVIYGKVYGLTIIEIGLLSAHYDTRHLRPD